VPLLDVSVTAPPTATSPVELTVDTRTITATKGIPVTTVGLRWKDWSASASLFPEVRFGSDGETVGGSMTRRENDLALGYALLPGMTVSLIHKSGRTSGMVTPAVNTLLGLKGTQRARGLLLGLSASAPMTERLSLYGNAAYGPGRYQVATDIPGGGNSPVRCTVADFGLAWHAFASATPGLVGAVTVQLGLRWQSVRFRSISLDTPAIPGVTVRAAPPREPQSTTHGLVLAVGVTL